MALFPIRKSYWFPLFIPILMPISGIRAPEPSFLRTHEQLGESAKSFMSNQLIFDQDENELPLGLSLQIGSSLQTDLQGILQRIFDQDEDEPPLGSRGPICVIAPVLAGGSEVPSIWSDRPVIVWQAGTAGRFVLRDVAANEIIWDYHPTHQQTHATYSGPTLQPDQTYELDIYGIKSNSPTAHPDFRILPSDIRQQMTDSLSRLAQPKPDDVSAIEWFAIQRASYFSTHDLPFDAIQALFSVSTPSNELSAIQQQVLNHACHQRAIE